MRNLPNLSLIAEPAVAPAPVERGKHRGTVNLREYEKLPKPERGAVNYFDRAGAPFFGLQGLGIRIYASGKRTWFISFYNKQGVKRRFTIGRADVLDYSDAYEVAKDKLADATKGNDPVETRRIERAEQARRASGVDSFEKLAREFLIPAFGQKDASAISRKDVRELLQSRVDAGHGVAANRLHALIRKIYNFGIENDLITENPAKGIRRLHDEVARERILTEDEIKKCWKALTDRDPDFADVWKLGLLLAQRRGEICGMKWSEVDLKTGWWSLPGTRTKNKLPHRVPLTGLALEILIARKEQAETGAEFVFPASRGGGCIVQLSHEMENLKDATSISDATYHDLRRTASSMMASVGVDVIVIEKLLNHTLGGMMKVYQRHSFDAEKRAALIRWDARVRQIVSAEPAKVIPLHGAA
jgi:integrase